MSLCHVESTVSVLSLSDGKQRNDVAAAFDDKSCDDGRSSPKHSTASKKKPSKTEDAELINNVVMLLEMLGDDEDLLTDTEQDLIAMLTGQQQHGTVITTTSYAHQRSRPASGRSSPTTSFSEHPLRNGKKVLNSSTYAQENVIVVLKAILRTVSDETIPFELDVTPPFRP